MSGCYMQAVYVEGKRYWFCIECGRVQASFQEAK